MIRKITLIAAVVFSASFSFAQVATVSTNLPASAAPGSTHKVVITVEKPGITGFAKLQQELPAGFTATQEEAAGSTFSFKDRKVKYLWMALPGDDSFKVSYSLTIGEDVSGTQVFEGAFSYIKDNETQKFPFSDIIKVENAAVQADPGVTTVDPMTSQPVTENTANASEEETGNEMASNDNSAEDEAAKKAEEEKRRIAAEEEKRRKEAEKERNNTPKPEKKPAKPANSGAGVIFRVQIAATHAPNTSASQFASKYSISDQVYEEQHEGWTKYTAGEFTSYTAAHSFRSSLRDNNGVEGAFVTAYNNGTRITTREALDLLGQ